MEWEYEINMDESYADIENIDEWGAAYVWLAGKGIGAEYNYCIDGECKPCAIYIMYEVLDENGDYIDYYTDTDEYKHYEIDFSDKEWKEKLIKAMKQFVIEHLEEENK